MRTEIWVYALLCSSLISLGGCGGGGSSTSPATTSPPIVSPPPNRVPSISGFVSAGNPSEAGQAVIFSWSTQDPDGDTLRCTFDPTGFGPVYEIANCAGQASVTHTYENPGTFPARLEVSDGALAGSITLNQRVTSDFMVTVLAPRASALVDTTLRIEARVTSPLEVSSVSAVVAGRSAALTFSPDEVRFIGTLSLAGLLRGEQRLDITARDINDRTTTATLFVTYDQRPTISITEPLDHSVSDGALRLRASCADDDPAGCTVRVLLDGTSTVIASAENALNEDVDLGDYDGRGLNLRFEARDAANQTTSESRLVYVETSATLTRVVDLQGPVLDINGTRILYRVASEDGYTLRIFDRVSGSSQTVPLPSGKRVSDTRSFLTPYGAIFTTQDIGGTVLSTMLYDWNRGQIEELGVPNSASSLEVAGDYAMWSMNGGQRIVLRNLATRTDVIVSNNAGNWRNDVAENGAVAFWNRGYDIELYRDGSSTVLTNDTEVWNTWVVTDGARVVYRKHTPCCADQVYAITLHDGTQEIELSPAVSMEPSPGRNFQIVPGWVAYTEIGNLGQSHIWLYGPNGTRQQLTFFGTSSTVELLAESGETMLANARRHHATTDATLTEVSSTLGRPFFVEGRWFIAIGRSVFEWAGVP